MMEENQKENPPPPLPNDLALPGHNPDEPKVLLYTVYTQEESGYLIRLWHQGTGEPRLDEAYAFRSLSLDTCRKELSQKGLFNLGRYATDGPDIVETWI